MTIKNQIIVDPNKAAKHELVFKARKLTFGLTPFDIPEKVESVYDSDKREFVIDLKYLTTNEPQDTQQVEANTTVSFGKNSGKLYSIKLTNIEKEEIPRIRIEIVQAIDSVVRNIPRQEESVKNLNLRLVRDLLSENETLYSAVS